MRPQKMGDVWRPDRPLSIHELKAGLVILEKEWLGLTSTDNHERLKISMTGFMLCAGYLGGFRGEEITQISLGGIRKYWFEGTNHPIAPHVPMILSGRFKRETEEKFYCQPMAFKSKSGIDLKIWSERVIISYKNLGIKSGPMFRNIVNGKVKRASCSDLDHDLHNILLKVQKENTRLLPMSVSVEDEFSIRRSIRRGCTAEAQNAQIPKEVIEASNRWRRRERACGSMPGISMMERYSDAKASIPMLI